MTHSMTGFATRRGALGAHVWVWDLRSVNGKGLDLRLRVPDWIDGLEAQVRAVLAKGLSRGNVSLTLKVARETGSDAPLRLNLGVLRTALALLAELEAEAMATGVTLAQASQADILSLRGVMEQAGDDGDTGALLAALMGELPLVLADLVTMRAEEGQALRAVILDQLAQIDQLVEIATLEAAARREAVAETLKQNVIK